MILPRYREMKLYLLPVTCLTEHAHVLLHYDLGPPSSSMTSSSKDRMMAWSETVLPTGSVSTVCSLLTQHAVLRELAGCVAESEAGSIDEKMVPELKSRVRFYSLGENSELCICAFLVNHVSSAKLNSSAPENHQFYYLWVSLKDIQLRLIGVDRVFRQPGISHTIELIREWTEKSEVLKSVPPSPPFTDIDQLKHRFRTLVWDLMEQKQETGFPKPCHNHIPCFKNREMAAENLASLCIFKQARVVKVDPSSAHEHARFLILASQKVLLMPSPDWKDAPFYKVDPKFLSRKQIQRACTQAGAASLGSVVSVNALGNLHVDLMVVGSVAVNPMTGARIGEGEGYADLEYALMAQLGAVSSRTVLATIVHESQLVADLPAEIMTPYDLPVSIVATPKRVVFCRDTFPRPTHIDLDLVQKTRESIVQSPAIEQYRKLAQAFAAAASPESSRFDTSGISSPGSMELSNSSVLNNNSSI